MHRAERLFQLIQHLRYDRAVTAKYLSEQLEVSERTVYRYIQDLSLSGVPITGEAGVGYVLMKGFQLAPLMFDESELAALLIGARMVQSWTDLHLARSATRALDKISHAIPDHLRPAMDKNDVLVPNIMMGCVSAPITELRAAINERLVIRFQYKSLDDQTTEREVHPLGMLFWGKVWTLIAWCLLRDDFRQFRLDGLSQIEVQKRHFKHTRGRTMQDFIERFSPKDV